MRDYQVRAFEPHHYVMLAEDPKSIFNGLDLDFKRIAANFANNGSYGRSGFCNSELLVSAGVMTPWPHYGVAWAILASNAANHPFFVHRAVAEGLWYFIHRLKLQRLEANVCDDLPQAKRWATHLGFYEESIMPKYGPRGETFRKYVILR